MSYDLEALAKEAKSKACRGKGETFKGLTRSEIIERHQARRREIIRLMELRDYNIKQIADMVGLSLGGIQGHIRDIKKAGIVWQRAYTRSPKRRLIHLARLVTTPGNAARAVQFAKEVLEAP